MSDQEMGFVSVDRPGMGGMDLAESPHAKAVVKEVLRRFFKLDFEKATITGKVGKAFEGGLDIWFHCLGEVVRTANVASCLSGRVDVELSEMSALGYDVHAIFARIWMEQLGLDHGYPCDVDVAIGREGHVRVEIMPWS